jgi:Domain of unknown function (DUF4145)
MTAPPSNFAFLQVEFPAPFAAAVKAESLVHSDPRTACFYARRALELAVAWAYRSDASLRLPYQDNLSALIHEPTFKAAAGEAVFSKARVINTLGNQAVHSHRVLSARVRRPGQGGPGASVGPGSVLGLSVLGQRKRDGCGARGQIGGGETGVA